MAAQDTTMERAKQLQEYYQQCEGILKFAGAFAEARWNPPAGRWKQGYFKDSHGPDRTHASPHVVNTSTAVSMICEDGSPFTPRDLNAFGGMAFEQVSKYYQISRRKYGWVSREELWSPYTCAWALRAVAASARLVPKAAVRAELAPKKALHAIVKEEVSHLIKFLGEWLSSELQGADRDFDHTYFVYSAFQGLVSLQRLAEASALASVSRMLQGFERLRPDLLRRISLEFYRQMTLKLTNVPQHLDVVSLSTALYCLLEFSLPDDELSEDVLAAAMQTVFLVQGPTGFWDTGTPLLGSQTGLVGCSSVEMALCLLRNSRSNRYSENYIDNYLRLFKTLHMSFKTTSPGLGWPTDIRRRDSGRQTWYGSMVFAFISLLACKLRSLAAAGLLRDFQHREGAAKVPFDMLRDYKGYVNVLRRAFIEPRQEAHKARTKGELDKARKKSRYSAILFGPPGTGKTSIAWALADALKFKFIEIGPGDFLRRGIDGLFSQGDEVFHRLMLAEDAVVLFDELDEWVLERGPEEDKLSRFLTTYMLPWLQRLRDKADIVFLFATNHLEHFDDAIKRHGRIDIVLPIGPPQGKDKASFLQDFFVEQGLARPDDAKAKRLAHKMLHRATIGDIKRALLRVIQNPGGYTEAGFLAELKAPKLLISPDEWKGFREQSAPYLESPHKVDSDRDPDETA